MYKPTKPKVNKKLPVAVMFAAIIVSNILVGLISGLVVFNLVKNNLNKDDYLLSVAGGIVEITAGDKVVSGFIVGKTNDNDPIIITGYSSLRGATDIKIALADWSSPFDNNAVILGYEERSDIAVISVDVADGYGLADINSRILAMGNSHEIAYGQSIFAIGNVTGNKAAITTGVISQPESIIRATGAAHSQSFILTSAVITEGKKGGPLVNNKGEVIGINFFSEDLVEGQSNPQLIGKTGYATPVNLARAIFANVMTRVSKERPSVGSVSNWNIPANGKVFYLDNYVGHTENTAAGALSKVTVAEGTAIPASDGVKIPAGTEIQRINGKPLSDYFPSLKAATVSALAELRFYYGYTGEGMTHINTKLEKKKAYRLNITAGDTEYYFDQYLAVNEQYLPSWLKD